MLVNKIKRINKLLFLSLLSILVVFSWVTLSEEVFDEKATTTPQQDVAKSYILQSKDYALLKKKIAELKVTPTHFLSIINSLAVKLTNAQLSQIQKEIEVKVTINHKVELSGSSKQGRRWQPEAVIPDYVNATYAHSYYNFGDDVTIGFLDTGLDQLPGLSEDLYGRDKVWGTYDAITDTAYNYDDEASGHGTHVASIAANSDYDIYGRIYGVAPNAALVGIKSFDEEGKGSYADVIRGIDWALQVKDLINLRVLNMSFSGPVMSHYWDDPLNQAVMKAWQAGVVVVASAGNTGPDPMTIGVPGNVPYIITVGAITDDYTNWTTLDDKVTSFSSAGPTYEGFVKPDIVAPGGHVSGLMAFDSQIVVEHPEFHDGGRYFEMSGTSQAAAVVSGVVALMLYEEPMLTPDEVKCRLVSSARVARTSNDGLAYSVFQQGAGVVNAANALSSTASGCVNSGLDIAKDLAGVEHYYGPANFDANDGFYIEGLGDEYVWDIDNSMVHDNTFIWRTNFLTDTFIWRTAFVTGSDLPWRDNFESDTFIWRTSVNTDTFIWRTSVDFDYSESIRINNWVEQQ